MRITVATLALIAGLLLSASLNKDAAPANRVTAGAALQAPTFSVSLGRGALRMRGVTASAEHEAVLLQLADDHYDNADTHAEFEAAVLLPGYWDTATNRLVYALAATESAMAIMQPDRVRIRAVSAEPDAFAARIAFFNESLGDDVQLVTDIVEVPAEPSLAALCRRVFEGLVLGPVSFRESSVELRESAFATLDRLVEYAHDCPAAILGITGHTDASGNESWNRQLSAARAQAVADYLAERGVAADRLTVAGKGSMQPVADNDTEIGRERNRRIEFELRY